MVQGSPLGCKIPDRLVSAKATGFGASDQGFQVPCGKVAEGVARIRPALPQMRKSPGVRVQILSMPAERHTLNAASDSVSRAVVFAADLGFYPWGVYRVCLI